MRRFGIALVSIAVVLVALAAPAAAHVAINPPTVAKGAVATIAFQVPNEKDNLTTNQVQVKFPDDHPIADAQVQSLPGWTVTVKKKTLATPIKTDEGDTLTQGIDTITWVANDKKGYGDSQFQQFFVSMAVPSDADSLSFPTVQTYSDGSTVNWVQVTPQGGPEPDNPVPVLQLKGTDAAASASNASGAAAPAAKSDAASKSDVDNAKTLSIIAIVIGALGLIVGIVGVAMARRRSSAPSTPAS